MAAELPRGLAVSIVELDRLFVIFLDGQVRDPVDITLFEAALERGELSEKPVAVALGDGGYLAVGLLAAMLAFAPRAGLPWLVGPLSTAARHLLDVSGIGPLIRIYDALVDAVAASHND